MLNIISREGWGAAPPKGTTNLVTSQVTHIVTHWPGTTADIIGEDTPKLLRGYQQYHMNIRNWRDIGYNFAVDKFGKIFSLRGFNVGGHVLAAQNKISLGILFVIGNKEPMTREMAASGYYLRKYLEDRMGRELRVVGHCDWANKVCPGPYVLPYTRMGMPLPTDSFVPPAIEVEPSKEGERQTAPPFPLREGYYFGPRYPTSNKRSVSGYYQRIGNKKGHHGLHTWQERMAYRGWRITPDGLYGDETKRVATAFQKEKGLVDDGLIGLKTWRAAWEEAIT